MTLSTRKRVISGAGKLHIEANKTVKLDNTDLEMLIEKYELLIKELDT